MGNLSDEVHPGPLARSGLQRSLQATDLLHILLGCFCHIVECVVAPPACSDGDRFVPSICRVNVWRKEQHFLLPDGIAACWKVWKGLPVQISGSHCKNKIKSKSLFVWTLASFSDLLPHGAGTSRGQIGWEWGQCIHSSLLHMLNIHMEGSSERGVKGPLN